MTPPILQSRKTCATTILVVLTLCIVVTACSVPVTGVVRLYDGLLKAATMKEAEAFCAIDGAPFRVVKPEDAALVMQQGVLFRCD